MSNDTTLCIVGAGMAGLSAGIYGQLNGFSTQIYEMHSLPGGLCTAWQRRGYWFDYCIRYLWGSGPDQWGYPLMSQVGAVGERIAEQVIARLDARFPGLWRQVEVIDVATPLTTERYTGNWQGSPQGWQTTLQDFPLGLPYSLPAKLDRLERFYMAGQ